MAPVKVTFKTVQGNKFELDLDSTVKVSSHCAADLLPVADSRCARNWLQPRTDRLHHHSLSVQVADVKQRIESSQGAEFPVSQQVIIYQGKVRRYVDACPSPAKPVAPS